MLLSRSALPKDTMSFVTARIEPATFWLIARLPYRSAISPHILRIVTQSRTNTRDLYVCFFCIRFYPKWYVCVTLQSRLSTIVRVSFDSSYFSKLSWLFGGCDEWMSDTCTRVAFATTQLRVVWSWTEGFRRQRNGREGGRRLCCTFSSSLASVLPWRNSLYLATKGRFNQSLSCDWRSPTLWCFRLKADIYIFFKVQDESKLTECSLWKEFWWVFNVFLDN